VARRSLRVAAVATLVLAGAVGRPAVAQAQAPDAYDAVSCASATTCLAVGGNIVVGTTDGGAHWSARTPPPNASMLTNVACSTAKRCEVTGDTTADAAVVYGTLDGGLTWHVQPAALPGGFFLAISCASRTMCVATGNEGAITRTVDGGRTWTGQTLADATLVTDVDCPTTLVCEAVADSGRIGVSGLAVRSTDGGLHWTVTELPSTLPTPNGVDCATTSACVVVGQDFTHAGSTEVGRIVTTTDGGVTWLRPPLPAGYTFVSRVDCPTVNVCVAGALGPRGLLGTVDAGQSWTPQGPAAVFFRDVSCPTATLCTAVGENNNGRGTIYATTNGGRTWHRQVVG
jgi:photosystem II stability/assembly factor-like uncharacterized protein